MPRITLIACWMLLAPAPALAGGSNYGGGPYAVTVDGAGRVWANEIDTDTVAVLDPRTEEFRGHNGRLGVIE